WVLTGRLLTTPSTFVLLPTGAGQPKTFPRDPIEPAMTFATFLPDGKGIVFVGQEAGKSSRVYRRGLAGGAARPVTPEGVIASLVSPDGKLLLSQQSGKWEFALTPLDGGGAPTPLRGFEPGDRPLGWTTDGGAVYVGSSERIRPARVFR